MNLRLTVWASPSATKLDTVETLVLAELLPPLNLSQVSTAWRPHIAAKRRALADEARRWMPS